MTFPSDKLRRTSEKKLSSRPLKQLNAQPGIYNCDNMSEVSKD